MYLPRGPPPDDYWRFSALTLFGDSEPLQLFSFIDQDRSEQIYERISEHNAQNIYHGGRPPDYYWRLYPLTLFGDREPGAPGRLLKIIRTFPFSRPWTTTTLLF